MTRIIGTKYHRQHILYNELFGISDHPMAYQSNITKATIIL